MQDVYKKVVSQSAGILVIGMIAVFLHVLPVQAQEAVPGTVHTYKAEVVEVLSEEVQEIPGLPVSTTVQHLNVELLEGPEAGQVKTIENDYMKFRKGDVFYLRHTVGDAEHADLYSAGDPYRMPVIYFFSVLFVLCVFFLGGKQGIRGLVALALSLLLILYILFPAILSGTSPVLVSIGIAALIIVVGSYITHGCTKVTTSAVFGMIITVVATGLLALAAVHFGKLSGVSSEETLYLNMDTAGTIDLAGLLLGSMLIGFLGVLYDAAISQSVSVDELRNVGPHLSRTFIFKRAMRIGREHIGALVNTLAIAYVGASLPLLLWFYNSPGSVLLTLNKELFASEILRALVGSIGLILAVPVTTFIAVWMLVRKQDAAVSEAAIAHEQAAVEHAGHKH